MAKPIIPLETRTKAIDPVLGGQQKQAAKRLGAGGGAADYWVKVYRARVTWLRCGPKTGMPARMALVLFQAISDLYEIRSVVYTTNIEFSGWSACSATRTWLPR